METLRSLVGFAFFICVFAIAMGLIIKQGPGGKAVLKAEVKYAKKAARATAKTGTKLISEFFGWLHRKI